ncbi:sulfur carrier protein ThiS [Pectinatus haikarae]|uniref:Thiamine biosynthesis protein ThiS n=1 Tax=Pectinatus haikarae TaxID=349096 RepID=A0ABT9Y6T7_9FIRM|nr:sulfur carrier protein ThiS [Pectinatus haikarae]MDQ0203537.1 thiamine biosynthesis protein ThiS [Pectinatus haikarae]
MKVQIVINGKKRQLAENISLQTVMDENLAAGGRAVAELNERIIDKQAWNETMLKENDVLEIVAFMGGGSK